MPLHLDGKSKPGPMGIDWQRVALAHEQRIAELEAALAVAQRRFELLAVVSDEMVNGVRPSVGAAECAAAIGHQR